MIDQFKKAAQKYASNRNDVEAFNELKGLYSQIRDKDEEDRLIMDRIMREQGLELYRPGEEEKE
jgi:hypothetical protein